MYWLVAPAEPAILSNAAVKPSRLQRVDVQFLQIDVDGLAIFVANLDGQFIFGAIENVNAVEVGGFRKIRLISSRRARRSLFLMESRSSEELVPFFA